MPQYQAHYTTSFLLPSFKRNVFLDEYTFTAKNDKNALRAADNRRLYIGRSYGHDDENVTLDSLFEVRKIDINR
jgi:hypothetical protein